jgi:hypothetical protein
MISREIRICPSESAHRSGVAWRIETESEEHRVENRWYLLVDGWWRSRVRAHRHLRYEGDAQQVLREGAGIVSPLVVGVWRGSDTRRCPGARTTPDMSRAGALLSSTRSGATAGEVLPPAWPRLPRLLLLLRRGGWRGKPRCSSSATGGRRRRVCRRRASRRPSLLSCCAGRSTMS